MNAPTTPTPPRQVVFDPTPEIFATDTAGSFTFPLLVAGKAFLGTSAYDEVRFVFSIWHPSGQRTIDLDRAYVELRASLRSRRGPLDEDRRDRAGRAALRRRRELRRLDRAPDPGQHQRLRRGRQRFRAARSPANPGQCLLRGVRTEKGDNA